MPSARFFYKLKPPDLLYEDFLIHASYWKPVIVRYALSVLQKGICNNRATTSLILNIEDRKTNKQQFIYNSEPYFLSVR